MEKRLIGRGILAGALAGLLAFLFARIFAEPQIQKAIDYEGAREKVQERLDEAAGLHPLHEHADVFSRAVQADVGLGVGMILFGAAMGALYGIAYTVCLGRTGGLRPRPLAFVIAGCGFLALYLVPFLKYPANPPAIGHEETISARTNLYLVMVGASVLLLAGAVVLGNWLRPRVGTWTATLLAAGAFVIAIGVVMLLLPSLGELSYNKANFPGSDTETPQPLRDASGTIVFPGFPADVLATFRLVSVGTQLVLWGALALIFAPLADRLLTPRRPIDGRSLAGV
jgi:hypothetical protein